MVRRKHQNHFCNYGYICRICDKKTSTERNMRYHYIDNHREKMDQCRYRIGYVKQITCKLCNFVCDENSNWFNHYDAYHQRWDYDHDQISMSDDSC